MSEPNSHGVCPARTRLLEGGRQVLTDPVLMTEPHEPEPGVMAIECLWQARCVAYVCKHCRTIYSPLPEENSNG